MEHEENCLCQKFDYEWCVLYLPLPTSRVYERLTFYLPVISITSAMATTAFLSDLNRSRLAFARMNARTRSIWGHLGTDSCLVIHARRTVASL